jgi:hypothetical protein
MNKEKYSEDIFEKKVCLIIERERYKEKLNEAKIKFMKQERIEEICTWIFLGFIIGVIIQCVLFLLVG